MFANTTGSKYKTEKDTPAYKIWHWHFSVSVPNIFLRTLEEMEEEGIYISGHDDIDQSLAEQQTATTRTIHQLAVLLEEGCEPYLLNPDSDNQAIYSLIVEHLKDWADEFNKTNGRMFGNKRSKEVMGVIMEDLQLLESLALHIHETGIKPIPVALGKPSGLLEQLQQFGSGMMAPDSMLVPTETLEKPTISVPTAGLLGDMVGSPTTLGRMKKWQR